MAEVNSQLGKVNLYFRDYTHFSNFLNGYYQALTAPIENPNGTTNMPLIGIDGKETDDDSLFGNRQSIIGNFIVMRDGYVREYGTPKLADFYNINIEKILSHSAVFNKLFNDFNAEADRFRDFYPALNEKANEYYREYVGDKKETEEAQKLAQEIKLKILEGLRICEKLKRIFGAANEYNIELMLIKMITGFLKDGLEFFDVEELFEDINHDRIIAMYKRYEEAGKSFQRFMGITGN